MSLDDLFQRALLRRSFEKVGGPVTLKAVLIIGDTRHEKKLSADNWFTKFYHFFPVVVNCPENWAAKWSQS